MPTRVSVIVPTHDRAALLPATLASVLAQTHPDVEVVVVDDGSTDDTPRVVARFGDRVRSVRQENQGVEAARRRGLRISTGRYVTFLDDDDLVVPTKLARQAALLDAHPEMGGVHCGYHFVDGEGRWMETTGRLPEGQVLRQLVWGCFPWSGGPLVRRECLEAVGPDEHRDWHGDWGMWLRVVLDGRELGCVQEPLGSYRMLPGSMIDARIANAERLVFNLLDQVFARWPMPAPIVAERPAIEAGWRTWLACRYYIGGFWDAAQRNLATAVALRPALAREPAPLLDALFWDAVSPRVRVYDPPAFLRAIFEHLPDEAAFLRPHRAALFGRVHAGLGLRTWAAGDRRIAAAHLAEAAAYDPDVYADAAAFGGVVAAYVRTVPHWPAATLADEIAAALPADESLRRRVRAHARAALGLLHAREGASATARVRALVRAFRREPATTASRALRRVLRRLPG